MDRRLTLTILVAALVLVAALAAGLSGSAGAPAASTLSPPSQPAACPMPETPRALSALPNDASVALVLAPAGMSGDFAKRLLADAGGPAAAPVDRPADV